MEMNLVPPSHLVVTLQTILSNLPSLAVPGSDSDGNCSLTPPHLLWSICSLSSLSPFLSAWACRRRCVPHQIFLWRLGISTNKKIKKLRNKNEQPKILLLLLLLLLSDLPQIFPLSSSSAIPHDPIFIDSIAIHFRILCHHISFKFISKLHCDESIQ